MNEINLNKSSSTPQLNRLAVISLSLGLITTITLIILIIVWLISIKYFELMWGGEGGNGRLAIFGIYIKLEIPLALIGGTIAIILGFRALSQMKRFSQEGKGKAIIGIILGFISVVPLLTFVLFVLPMIGRMLDSVFSGF